MRALAMKPSAAGSARPDLELVDLPVPVPNTGEILVRIRYAALNYLDYESWRGDRAKFIAKAAPKHTVISGIEMAGIAESNGTRIKQGDEIFGYTHIFKGPWFHADYVVLNERKLARVPRGMSLEGAASIVGGALTAIAALERIARLERGQKVLITAATGSVGINAVQLASHLGADVTATCHSSQLDFTKSEGASDAYAYDRGEMPEAANQFDVVLDAAPSLSFGSARKYLTPRGTYVTTMPHLDFGGFLGSLFSRRKWGFLLVSDTDEGRLGRLRALMEEGVFRPVIESIIPVDRAVEAFERQQGTGKRGKILLDFSS